MRVCLTIIVLTLSLLSVGFTQQIFYEKISTLAGYYNWGASWWTPYQWYRYAFCELFVKYTRSLARPTYLNAILSCSQYSRRSTVDLYIDTIAPSIPRDSWVYSDGIWSNWKQKLASSYYIGRVTTPLGSEGWVLVSFNIDSWINSHPNYHYYITLDQNGDDWDACVLQVWLGPQGMVGLSEGSVDPIIWEYGKADAIPNPTSLPVEIRYHLRQSGHVNVKIYDVQGRIMRIIACEHSKPGSYSITWDGTDAKGVRVQPGRYFYRLESSDQALMGSVIVGR